MDDDWVDRALGDLSSSSPKAALSAGAAAGTISASGGDTASSAAWRHSQREEFSQPEPTGDGSKVNLFIIGLEVMV